MKKKAFSNPLVILTTAELNDSGAGSLTGGVDSLQPIPLSFDEWTQSRFCTDVDYSGGVDFADYVAWWASNGFGDDTWMQYNNDVVVTEEEGD